MLMAQIIGLTVAIVVGLVMVINASYMLVSPRRWFGLPTWLRAQGTMRGDQYASGWGAVQVRLGGALVLGAIAWVLYDMAFARR